ncbi:MAG TPA: hypothetical protein VIL52_00360 [Bacteroidota bacterium]
MMKNCHHCAAELERNAAYCNHCGAVQQETAPGTVECENHTEEHAVGVCVLCGKPVCGDCAVSAEGKIFCENALHQSIFKQWAVVHESSFEFESDMIRQNIVSAGIDTKVFSFRDHVGTSWLSDVKPVRVLVPAEQQQRAQEILQSLRLIGQHESE